jgi:hypothetical protein
LIQARSAIAAFVETVYNRQRLHSALDYRQCEATMRTIVIFNVTKLEGLIQRENRVRNTKFITKTTLKGRRMLIRLIAVAGFTLAVATSAQSLTSAPIHQPNGMITQVAFGCGPGRTMVNGVCVARTTIRQTRRAVRRCVRWSGGTCAQYE